MGPGTLAGWHDSAWQALGRELEGAGSVDEVATVALTALTQRLGVRRAGLALTVPGGRQLRFVPSDPDRLAGPVQWCLIDAYDQLPLNDAVRTGDDVVVPDRQTLAERYPSLAARQGSDARSVVALALVDGPRRIGGLLLYLDEELASSQLGPALSDVKAGIASALRAAQDVADADDALPPGHRLPADETAPALARRFLRQTLGDWGVADDVVESALLCASEIVTNVVMHVARPSVIAVERTGDAVTVRVSHQAVTPGPPTELLEAHDDQDPLDVAGRGLALVDAVATGWGVDQQAGLTCWWFRVG